MSYRVSARLAATLLLGTCLSLSAPLAHAQQRSDPQPWLEQQLLSAGAFASSAFDSTAIVNDLSDPVMSRLFAADGLIRARADAARTAPNADRSPDEGQEAGGPAPSQASTSALPTSDVSVAGSTPGQAPRPRASFSQSLAPQLTAPQITPRSFRDERSRPGALLPLYVSFTALQVLDAASTLKAIDNGGREANPMVAPFTSSPATLYGLKAATAVGTILVTEKLWKRNRVAAVVTMVALNVGYAMVTHHNYRVAGRR